MKNQRTARVVAAFRVEGEVSSSEEEEPEKKKKSKKTKKEKVAEEVAVIEKQPPTTVQPITSLPQSVTTMNTASTPPLSNDAIYGSSSGEQRRGRGRYDRGRNYASPAEMSARRRKWTIRGRMLCV